MRPREAVSGIRNGHGTMKMLVAGDLRDHECCKAGTVDRMGLFARARVVDPDGVRGQTVISSLSFSSLRINVASTNRC